MGGQSPTLGQNQEAPLPFGKVCLAEDSCRGLMSQVLTPAMPDLDLAVEHLIVVARLHWHRALHKFVAASLARKRRHMR